MSPGAQDSKDKKKRGLGSGINALIPQKITETEGAVTALNINEIEPNREQPRKKFDDAALAELAESISTFGIIQPLIVRENAGYYEIVAGERRWRAARIAGLTEIPVIIRDYDELKALEVSLIENIQRENLNAVEEALTYRRLQEEFSLTQEQIAERVGKKRPTVANSLRLLLLPQKALSLLANGKISAGHARALLAVDDAGFQEQLAQKIAEDDLSVRQVEALTKKMSKGRAKKPAKVSAKPDARLYYKSAEENLSALYGTRVKVHSGKSKGKIEIDFFSDADLDRLVRLLMKLEA